MKTSSLIMAALLCAAAFAAGGCMQVDTDTGGSKEIAPSTDQPSQAPYDDGRTIAQLRHDNSQLRSRLAKLEQNDRNWQSQVDARKRQIDDLKRQRDQLKKERDRYKKRLEND